MCGEQSSLFTFRKFENSILAGSTPEIDRYLLNYWAEVKLIHRFVISIKFRMDKMYFKRNPWHGPKKISLNYTSSIFDDFQVFWMETWAITCITRGSRKSRSFLRQLYGYLTMSTFRNRKYRTALVYSNLNNELCSLANKHQ
jgi:hypothetical protein